MKIVIIGLGYVGINLFNLIQRKYKNVLGVDKNIDKINNLNKGFDPSLEVKNFSKYNNSNITENLLNIKNIDDYDYFFICVPTPKDKLNKPVLKYLNSAIDAIFSIRLKKPITIINESSVYPGATEKLIDDNAKGKGLKRNKDYFIAYSPERISPGEKDFTLRKVSKIVASDDKLTLKKVSSIYSKILKGKIIKSYSIAAAEGAKLIENTQRDVNIALMNEFYDIFEKSKVDFSEVHKLASTKWNFNKYFPGYVGGHCIAVDPYYIIYFAKKLKADSSIIRASRKKNEFRVYELAKKIKKIMPFKSKILILGVTYKENVNDIRESQSIKLIKLLQKYKNIDVNFYDPLIKKINIGNNDIESINLEEKTKYEAIIEMTMHDEILRNMKRIKIKMNNNCIYFPKI